MPKMEDYAREYAKNRQMPKGHKKVGKVMGEYKEGELHMGRSGKKVTSRKQAIAIALSEQRRAEAKK